MNPDEMVSRLGDLLRMTLDSSGLHEVPFKEELEFLKHLVRYCNWCGAKMAGQQELGILRLGAILFPVPGR